MEKVMKKQRGAPPTQHKGDCIHEVALATAIGPHDCGEGAEGADQLPPPVALEVLNLQWESEKHDETNLRYEPKEAHDRGAEAILEGS